MTGWPDQPVIYEINTTVWLNGLARAAGGGSPWPAWRTPAVPLASLRRHKLTPSRRRSISPSTGSAENKSLGGPRHEYQVAA
jgi:hypothetical protein